MVDELQDRIAAFVADNAGCSGKQILAAIRAKESRTYAAIRALESSGRLTNRGHRTSPKWHVAGEAAANDPQTSEPPPEWDDSATWKALADREGERAERLYTRRLERELGKRQYLTRMLERSLVSAFDANPIQLGPRLAPRKVAFDERMITVLVSDAHFGGHVDPREVPGNAYNWRIASRRMAKLASDVCAWKAEHRPETRLQIVLAGDLIEGKIHLDDSGIRPLTEQIHGAAHILIGFIDYVAQHFRRVDVIGLPGNHDRVTVMRQVAQRWDSHAHAIYLAIAQAFRNDPNVNIDVPLTGDAAIELPGGKELAFYTHGDVKPTVANVGKAINIQPMLATLRRLNASGAYGKPIRVIAVGHWHAGCVLPTGAGTLLVNGSVVGPNCFARNGCNIVGEEGAPMQLMFESVPGFAFGDSRFVSLREADHDASFDEIIRTPDLSRWAA